MFTKEKTTNASAQAGATLISQGTIVNGDLVSEGDLRIDGTINGNVSSNAKIIVGPNGYVEGNIDGITADISGRVSGNIRLKELLQMRASANVQGNITTGKLQVDPDATFNGQCQMTGAHQPVQIGEHALAAASE